MYKLEARRLRCQNNVTQNNLSVMQYRKLRIGVFRKGSFGAPPYQHQVFVWLKYAFIKAHRSVFSIDAMFRVLDVQHSGFYAWLKAPFSNLSKDNKRLMGLIKQAWLESGCIYGYRKIHDDLHCLRETLSSNRAARLLHGDVIKAQICSGWYFWLHRIFL